MIAAARRIDLQADFCRLGQERRIGECFPQRLAQRGEAVRRHGGRHQQRSSERERSEGDLHQQLVVGIGDQIGRKRNVAQRGELSRPELHDRLGLLSGSQVGRVDDSAL